MVSHNNNINVTFMPMLMLDHKFSCFERFIAQVTPAGEANRRINSF